MSEQTDVAAVLRDIMATGDVKLANPARDEGLQLERLKAQLFQTSKNLTSEESGVPRGMEGSSMPSSSLPKPKPKIEMPPQAGDLTPAMRLFTENLRPGPLDDKLR